MPIVNIMILSNHPLGGKKGLPYKRQPDRVKTGTYIGVYRTRTTKQYFLLSEIFPKNEVSGKMQPKVFH